LSLLQKGFEFYARKNIKNYPNGAVWSTLDITVIGMKTLYKLRSTPQLTTKVRHLRSNFDLSDPDWNLRLRKMTCWLFTIVYVQT